MSSKIKKESDGSYTVSVNFKFEGSMLEMEDHIQEMVNEMGLKATLAALEKFDSEGEAIFAKGKALSSKGKVKKSTKRPTERE
jgi:hypothetical protein